MNARSAPGSQSSLREANRARVLEVVSRHGPLTQVEIAKTSGLSPATVSNLVRELDHAGLVELSPSVRNGRRAVLVAPASGGGLLAGFVFGPDDVHLAIADDSRKLRAQQRTPLSPDDGLTCVVRRFADLAESIDADLGKLTAIAVGRPSSITPNWRGEHLAATLTDHLRAPVALDTTANLAALGELRTGALQGVHNGCYLKLADGVSTGLILNGELFRGSAGTAGEIGHVTIDANGPICPCGNRGCLNTYVGSHALISSLTASHGPLSLTDIVDRALQDDFGCRRVIEDAGRRVGIAVAGLVNLLNPEVIAVGGVLATAGELVLLPLREALDHSAIPSAAAAVELRLATAGAEAELRGAVQLAAHLFNS
ncbi:ROK family transcriptional regulator [Kribbella sandramycini]|uniref:Putative NBD/HSP70 family sugar kinase n=1 Tax=Kribbella sandramycini TaxID=60450 RepID=A0A7Y4KWA4_9ACTN|nr:ROK family transcriptional regulator [Kribbella sandramycini]MBB6568382.1 putative NBD/HSP70 family sugar kinase [Kribbella sandramycini]NOL39026.1 ROK family transcriptional regulator [Kribbella sandramycini]